MEHYHTTIQGWFFYENLYRWIVQQAVTDVPLHFVELGCWKGRSTAFMGVEILNSGKTNITFTAIDWFKGSDEEAHKRDPEVANLFEVFRRNLAPVQEALGDRFVVLKEATTLAAEQFADESVHFIMVDAGHTAEAVEADIRAWLPKLAPGGIMAGDDWRWPTVRAGVRAGLREAINQAVVAPVAPQNTHEYPWWLTVKYGR